MRKTEHPNRQPTFDPPSIPPYDKGGRPRPAQCTTALVLGLTLALAAGLAPAAPAEEPADRLDRQVRVMERVLDDVLVHSSHVMVSADGNTRGLVLEEFGALFTFDASLGNRNTFGRLEYIRAEELATRAREKARQARKEGDEEAATVAPDEVEMMLWRGESEKEQKEHLDGIQAELIAALLDYGPTLGALRDQDWVAVAAFFGGGLEFRLGHAGKARRLVLKVKMGDLRQFNLGRTSRQEVTGKIKIDRR